MAKSTRTSKNKGPEEKEKSSFSRWRYWFVALGVVFALLCLLLRTAWIQVLHPDRLVREGDLRSLRVQPVSTPRGMITDRAGRPMAVSVPVDAVWADPKEIADKASLDRRDRWNALADAVGIPLDKLTSRVKSNPNSRFIYLARQISPSLATYIRELKIPGIYLKQESRRFYPSGEVSAHIIGFTNIDGKGIEGVEKSFDTWLTGEPGKRVVRKDRFGRVVENISAVESRAAHDLSLSIDDRLQAMAYRELKNAVAFNKAESGSIVLLDVQTGEVLAMANLPSYNPNNRAQIDSAHYRNRAITDTFEPGSTVKPLVVLAALDRKVVKENAVLNTMPFYVNGHRVRDTVVYPELTLTGVLQKSSNVGVTHLALAMPETVLPETYRQFGFGQPTNLGLIGESQGMMLQKKRWADIERATFSFGYGLMVTPLQLARAYATLGSFGIYRPLSITKVDPPVQGNRVYPEEVTRKVVHMMEAVALPGGGGRRAAVDGYRVAVKTGTAKKIGPNGKYVDKYIAYTAGVAPASNPRLALVVVINEPQAGQYYGGAVSAPVFSAIMGSALRILNIQPDALPSEENVVLSRSEKARVNT